MKVPHLISLKNRIALTYVLFISVFFALLTLIINYFTGAIFLSLIKENIAQKSIEIVRTIGEQYNPQARRFDELSIEAVGMYFVHEGYIVTVEDEQGGVIWDARSCDMQECAAVINTISERMEKDFRLKGGLQTKIFPITYNNSPIGTITIETYGPVFYSEAEAWFLSAMNRVFLAAGILFVLASIAISFVLAGTIARPIVSAREAARRIAKAYSKTSFSPAEKPSIRILEPYRTQESADLAAAINELAVELEESDRRQKQLTSDIAHELRTPLTCLQGNLEAMIDGVCEADETRLMSCHEEIIRLTKLVQDLNILTNLEYHTVPLEKSEFDLALLVASVAGQFTQQASEKGIRIDVHAPATQTGVTADYDRIKQVLINLLSNAVKYTDSGAITVTIEADDRTRTVSVADTGIGIPQDELPRIFERFYRSDKSRSRASGGAGIGLTIAAAIVAAHGGTITAESAEGRGSVFKVIF
jgi:signal transduction histidine kinase